MTGLVGSSADHRIGAGMQVTLHFAILLADGSEIDSTRRGKHLQLVSIVGGRIVTVDKVPGSLTSKYLECVGQVCTV